MLTMSTFSELTDTLSFGLVRMIRKKTHSINDHVQTINDNSEVTSWRHSKSFTSLTNCKLHSSTSQPSRVASSSSFTTNSTTKSRNTSQEDVRGLNRNTTITAAYNFDSSLMSIENSDSSYNLKRTTSMPEKRLTTKPQRSTSLPRTQSGKAYCPVPVICKTISKVSLKKNNYDDNFKTKSESTINSTVSSDVSYSTNSILVSHPRIPAPRSKSNRKVTISDAPTNIVNGEPFYTQKLIAPSMRRFSVESDAASLYSLDPELNFKLVYESTHIPGFP